jgi:hypothetical protein
MRLLLVELWRMGSRRLVQALVLLSIAGIVVSAVIAGVNSRPPTQEELAQAELEVGMQVQDCVEHPDYWPAPPEGHSREDFCEELVGQSFVQDERFRLISLRSILEGVSLAVATLGWAIGASLVGAEWHTGTVTTLLTWEPRRVRVFVAKVTAAVVGVAAIALALQALLGGALALVAVLRGTTEGADGSWLTATAGTAVRSALLASFGAAVAFAIASVARNTAAALGTVFVWLAVVEGLVRALRPGWAPWLIADNAIVFLTGSGNIDRTMMGAGLLLVSYAIGLATVACVAFARRDVT